MTKADIVNEIAKSTGVEKVQVQAIVEAFMENVKNSMIGGENAWRTCLSPRFRQLHHQEACYQSRPQHLKEYNYYHTRA